MRNQGEPSVEEILDSIKKVIARDNREALQAERRHRESAGMGTPMMPAPSSEQAPQDDHVLDLGMSAEMVSTPDSDALTTESAAQAMRESLAALAMLAEPGTPPQIVRSGETSLEELTRELLRPMLARWLDENLPPMVERLVTAEIARIAHKNR